MKRQIIGFIRSTNLIIEIITSSFEKDRHGLTSCAIVSNIKEDDEARVGESIQSATAFAEVTDF